MIAKEWGLTPFEFWELSNEEKTVMIAASSAISKMTTWEDEKTLEKSKRESESSSRAKRRPSSPRGY